MRFTMSTSSAFRAFMEDKIFRGSKRFDFVSNMTKTTATEAPSVEITSEMKPKDTQDALDHNRVALPQTTRIVHPFIRFSKPCQLRLIVEKFFKLRNKNGTLVKVRYSSDVGTEVVEHRMSDIKSVQVALDIMKRTKDFKKLIQLSDEVELTDVDIENMNIVLDDSFFDSTISKDDGSYVTNEEKILYALKNEFNEENHEVLVKLVRQYTQHLGSAKSSKSVFLMFANAALNSHFIDSQSFNEIFSDLLYQYPRLKEDPEILNVSLKFFLLSEDTSIQLKLIQDLQELGYAPSTSSFNNFLRRLSKQETPKVLESLIGLDDVIYACLDGETIRLFLPLCKKTNDLVSLLNLAEYRIPLEERKAAYSKFSHELITILLRKFHKNGGSIKYEIIQKIKKYTELEPSTERIIIKDVIRKGSLILASTLIQKYPGPIDFEKLQKLANKRVVYRTYSRPGYDKSSKRYFLQFLEAQKTKAAPTDI